MHSDHLYCHNKRCCRKACLTGSIVLLLAWLGLAFGLHAVNRKVEALKSEGYATKADVKALRDEGLSLFGGLKSDLERTVEIAADGLAASVLEHDGLRTRIDEAVKASEKRSHELRVKLAGELRKELTSAIEAERSTRGHQITAEISKRRNETGELFDGLNKTYDALLRHQGEITALRKQLFALEQAQLKHRCPEPCRCAHTPPAPAKVMPAPVPNMYTIPYQGAYVAPRCR